MNGAYVDPLEYGIGNIQMPTSYPSLYGQPQILEAGLGGLLGLIPKGASLVSRYWPYIAGALGGLSLSQLIGGGNGGVTTGGTSTSLVPGTSIPLVGPFAPEPPAQLIAKEWGGIGGSRFYLLINGKMVVRKRNGVYKLIKRPRMLHMKVSNPRMGDVVKADKIVARTAKILRRRLK